MSSMASLENLSPTSNSGRTPWNEMSKRGQRNKTEDQHEQYIKKVKEDQNEITKHQTNQPTRKFIGSFNSFSFHHDFWVAVLSGLTHFELQ